MFLKDSRKSLLLMSFQNMTVEEKTKKTVLLVYFFLYQFDLKNFDKNTRFYYKTVFNPSNYFHLFTPTN